MARKKKNRKKQMPPLSWVDKFVYWTVIILSFGGMSVTFLPVILYQKNIAFSDETVIACSMGLGIVFTVPLSIWFLVIGVCTYESGYKKRLPLFGIKGFRYGPPQWAPKYPLFMKNKPSRYCLTEKQKATVGIVIVLSVLCWAVLPLSFYERTCLHEDGSITYYNAVNQAEERWDPEDIRGIKLDTDRVGGKSTSLWSVEISFVTDQDDEITFKAGEFSSEWEKTMETMLRIKERYLPAVTIRGTDNLEQVVKDHDLTEVEQALLYQLFDVSKEP